MYLKTWTQIRPNTIVHIPFLYVSEVSHYLEVIEPSDFALVIGPAMCPAKSR